MKQKPISMVREELINKLVAAANESGLSYFMLEYIFRDLLSEIHNGAVRQAQAEREEYMKTTKANAAPDSASSAAHVPEGTTVEAKG